MAALIVYGIAGLILTALVWVYILFFHKRKGDYIILVNYAELVGERIVEHRKTYDAVCNDITDTMSIKPLSLMRPVPPIRARVPLTGGGIKVYLVKIDTDRYAYRLPNKSNEMLTYKRDPNGNILKNKGSPIIVKHKWTLIDDIVESDTKHWDVYVQKLVEDMHQERKTLWDKWGAPISMAMIFLFGVIMLYMSNKNLELKAEAIMGDAIATQKEAARTTQNMNNLIERITGTRVFEQEQPKQNDGDGGG